MAERSAKQLGLSKADLPNSIIEVIATLSKSGFEAYIVGGGVRDNLLGLSPKDFDAVTDAKPHEIKDLFGKRCRIIGRRFQLAHVYSGRDMIEVATFRAPPNGDAHTTSDGMIVRDNVWGDIEQDFARRDFSINALYYQPIKGIVHDFCNALADIENKTLRLLGHAPVRIEEDPVRLLRALRFKAKLGFDFDKELSEQFHDDNWSLLEQVSPHRLYDESQKMFTGGYLVPLLPLLFEFGAIRHLIIYPPETPTALVNQVAINTDKRIAQGKSINPAFFYAALLWDNYLYQLAKFKKKNMPFHDAQLQAASKVIDRQRIKTAIPKFAEQFIRDIWLMQPKLANPRVNQISQLADHPRFRAAFDFLLLREHCDDAANPLSESTNGMGEWWQTYQTLSDKQKQQAIDDFAGDARRGANKRSRGRGRNRARNTDNENLAAAEQGIEHNAQPSSQSESENRSETNAGSKSRTKDSAASSYSSSEQSSRSANGRKTQQDSDNNQQVSSDRRVNKTNSKMASRRSAESQEGRSKPQHMHYAREREQLQKLSLGELVGDQLGEASQPKPLFTINAAKMAKQVPQQAAIAKQVAKAEPKRQAKPAKHEKPVSAATNSVVNLEGSTPKPVKESTAKATSDKAISQDISKLAAHEAVLLPKEERVPSKRRRRIPSTTVTQTEQTKGVTNSSPASSDAVASNKAVSDAVAQSSNNTGATASKAHVKNSGNNNSKAKANNKAKANVEPSINVEAESASSKSTRTRKTATKTKTSTAAEQSEAKRPTAKQKANGRASNRTADQMTEQKVAQKSDKKPAVKKRTAKSPVTAEPDVQSPIASNSIQQSSLVPATRRRRQPSSDKTVTERQGESTES
ncbi:polynucleotide adenylyltransferase PcnB [Psychrobacter pygoscelis]|uniref:polynucleotide adenylyltransferase PcnB n=1 Tax=Psychrobacter pygoscelis TaxID=2488563 RepID=UPI0010396077|nr:polynucleotide adenylyltransferase PcnB [Psychrobacter pygoscelis]